MKHSDNFPPDLIARFQELADEFEAYIRADERARIGEKFAAAFPSKPVAKPKPETLFPITDLHGEPLQEIGAQPKTYDPAAAFDYAGQGLNETHRRPEQREIDYPLGAAQSVSRQLRRKLHVLAGDRRHVAW